LTAEKTFTFTTGERESVNLREKEEGPRKALHEGERVLVSTSKEKKRLQREDRVEKGRGKGKATNPPQERVSIDHHQGREKKGR